MVWSQSVVHLSVISGEYFNTTVTYVSLNAKGYIANHYSDKTAAVVELSFLVFLSMSKSGDKFVIF